MRVLLPLVLATTSAKSFQDTLVNCTQQVLSQPTARSAVTVLGRWAVFATEDHMDGNHSGLVDIFDAQNGAWSTSQMSHSRTNMCATSWGPLAIFAGGSDGRGLPKSRNVDVWDSRTGAWSLRTLAMGRDLLACASAGGVTLFAGGSAPQANQSETASVEMWDHADDSWSVLPQVLSQPRKKPEAVAVGERIVISGGEIAKAVALGRFTPGPPPPPLGSYTGTMDVFEAKTRTWESLNASLPTPMQYFGAARASGRATPGATDGVAVFAGGFYNDIRLGATHLYDPLSRRFVAGPPLAHNRSNLHAASVGADGRYAAFGAGNIDATAKVTLDFYDGDTGEWAHSHTHTPIVGNGVVSAGNVALFAGFDGRIDAIALDGDCSMSPGGRAAAAAPAAAAAASATLGTETV